jgi:cytochrome b pre-mRNA-processing protein 3
MILFSRTKRREREAAERLYRACAEAARAPALFLDFGVPDSLQGRFEMLTLHLFPLLHRLSQDPGDDPALARLVSERFVSEMDATLREMGVGDVTVPKRMKTLYRSFGGRIGAYAQALAGGKAALTEAVARNVFPDGAPPAGSAALANHLEALVATLQAADLSALRLGEVAFPEPEPLPKEEPAHEG